MEVTPIEDLSREHGLLNRAFLIYEEFIRRLNDYNSDKMKLLQATATIIRIFIEDHHEKTEENYIFPILIKHNKNVDVVDVLIKQHNIGRIMTSKIMKLSSSSEINEITRCDLIRYMTLFIKMYRYHEAIEDTEIFPKVRELLNDDEYKKLSDILEEEEEHKLGDGGYKKYLHYIQEIEKKLNINTLDINFVI
jgi:hemerythrin-like domain-containing protein